MTAFMKGSSRRTAQATLPALREGDRLDQKTFHERYEATDEDVRAELIGGIVYMAAPQNLPHSKTATLVGRWLQEFEEDCPGTECLPGITNIMGPDSEPEPDHCLLLRPEYGGQTRENEDGYLEGAPELIVETSATTERRELHQKKADYEKAGVREYVVVAVQSQQVFWFRLRAGNFHDVRPQRDGILRSKVFPGLWLDPTALLKLERDTVLRVVREGLASAEHQAFVQKLARRKPRSNRKT